MPFYQALQYALTTATGKIKRRNWEPGYYVCRGFMNSCFSVIFAHDNIFEPYTAKPDDMTANDWEIYEEG